MAPKKEMDPDLKKGDVIQAVVIADPFNTKFGPLTTPTMPKVNVNVTMQFKYERNCKHML